MSINGLGELLESMDNRLRREGFSEERIAQIRWDALAPIARRLNVTMPPRPTAVVATNSQVNQHD